MIVATDSLRLFLKHSVCGYLIIMEVVRKEISETLHSQVRFVIKWIFFSMASGAMSPPFSEKQ